MARARILALGVLQWALLSACASQAGGFQDIEGVARRPLDATGATANVLIFSTIDCPIANGYAPAIGELVQEFEPAGFRFFLVHVDPDVDAAAARAHAGDYGYALPVLLDPEHLLVDQVGATVTPEAAVLAPGGELVYRGRIDDWYAALGKKRRRPTTSELRDALEALAAGREVPMARAAAVGCLIPD